MELAPLILESLHALVTQDIVEITVPHVLQDTIHQMVLVWLF